MDPDTFFMAVTAIAAAAGGVAQYFAERADGRVTSETYDRVVATAELWDELTALLKRVRAPPLEPQRAFVARVHTSPPVGGGVLAQLEMHVVAERTVDDHPSLLSSWQSLPLEPSYVQTIVEPCVRRGNALVAARDLTSATMIADVYDTYSIAATIAWLLAVDDEHSDVWLMVLHFSNPPHLTLSPQLRYVLRQYAHRIRTALSLPTPVSSE